MQVVALVERGPLVADERGEAARLVVMLGGRDGLLPRAAIGLGAGHIHQLLGKGALGKVADDVERGIGAFARLHHVIPLATHRLGEYSGLPAKRSGKKPMLSE